MIDLDALDAEAERKQKALQQAPAAAGATPAPLAVATPPAPSQTAPEPEPAPPVPVLEHRESSVVAAHPEQQPVTSRRLPRALPTKKAKNKTLKK